MKNSSTDYILSKLSGVKKNANGWMARCPAHDDKQASLSISENSKGVLLYCHAGCDTENICHRLGINMSDLFYDRPEQRGSSKTIICTYDYHDATERLLFQKVRYNPKGFNMRRPDETGGWIWNRKGLTTVPYRLPSLLKSEYVFICEGEKDADNLNGLGLCASCSPDGAGKGKWKAHYNDYFTGKRVYILFDNDVVGKLFAAEIADNLNSRAAQVKLIDIFTEWTDAPEHADISDYITKFGEDQTLAMLKKLGNEAGPRTSNHPPPEEYTVGRLKPNDFSDVGEAVILAREYSHTLHYTEATSFLYYDGSVWIPSDIKAQEIQQILTDKQLAEAEQAVTGAYAAMSKAVNSGDTAGQKTANEYARAAKEYQKFIVRTRSSGKISAVLNEVRPMLDISVEKLDSNPFALNTPAGEVDLYTGKIELHLPESLHTKITTATPDSNGIELWEKFLNDITCNRPELSEFLQMLSGAAIIGRVYTEMLIVAYGNGRNGKSTFFNLLSRVLGGYAGQISAETLTTSNKISKNWEIAELRGKRLILAPELEEGTRLDSAFVKKICSSDKIMAEQKYKAPFAFEPSHTVVLFTNHLPRVGSNDEGTWRRLVVVPFDAVIDGRTDIKNYADFLYRNAGGAALAWMIDGARKFINADYRLTAPDCVLGAVNNYRAANDWLSNYLSERCEIASNYIQKSGELYKDYRAFCLETGEYTRSAADFKAALENKGFRIHKNATGTIVYGMRILNIQPNYTYNGNKNI